MTRLLPALLLLLTAVAPAHAAPRAMTLAQALQAAARRNVQLDALRLEVDRAEAQLGRAWSLLLPGAQGGLQYVRADHPDEVDFGGATIVVRRQDDLSGSLSVNLPLIRASSWSAISLARQGTHLARLTVAEGKQQLLLQVAQSYHVARMSQALVQLRQEQIRSATHHLEVATRKHEAGNGLRLDVIRAETDLAQAQQELLSARLSLETACDTLGLLTGVGGRPMPHAERRSPARVRSGARHTTPRETPEPTRPMLDEGQLLQRSRSRLDLQISRANLELARRQVRSSWSALLPALGVGWQASFQITDPSDFGDQDRTRWSTALTLSVPLLDAVTYHDIRQRRIERRQAELRLRDAELNAGKAVRQARRDYLAAQASERIARRQVELAAEGLKLAQSAYEAGAGSSLEVTDARRTATSAETTRATRQLETRIALLALQRASGEDLARVYGPAGGQNE